VLRAPVSFACVLASALCASCSNTALPGTQLGTYAVTATLGTNSCGAGLAPPSPWTFDVQMSEQGSTLYYGTLDGTPPLSSTLSSNAATLSATESTTVDTAPDGGPGPCAMTRTDTLQVQLASGNPPPSMTGSIEYAFDVVNGADCSDQLAVNGGMYDALPCTVTYSMTASRK
jgi:hypothetical protein